MSVNGTNLLLANTHGWQHAQESSKWKADGMESLQEIENRYSFTSNLLMIVVTSKLLQLFNGGFVFCSFCQGLDIL